MRRVIDDVLIDVVRHGSDSLGWSADFASIRAATVDAYGDDSLVSAQVRALSFGHEWHEPDDYADAPLPITDALVAFQESLHQWKEGFVQR